MWDPPREGERALPLRANPGGKALANPGALRTSPLSQADPCLRGRREGQWQALFSLPDAPGDVSRDYAVLETPHGFCAGRKTRIHTAQECATGKPEAPGSEQECEPGGQATGRCQGRASWHGGCAPPLCELSVATARPPGPGGTTVAGSTGAAPPGSKMSQGRTSEPLGA